MLPKNLAIFSRKGKFVFPKIADAKDIALIRECLEVFRNLQGRTLSEVRERFFEVAGDDKFAKALFHTLTRLSTWRKLNPSAPEIRKFLFSFGPVLEPERKKEILRLAQEKFGIKSIREMWGDEDEYRTLEKAPGLEPEKIAKKFNTFNLQAILLECPTIVLYLRERAGEVLRRVKALGLMWEGFVSESGKMGIRVFGPISQIRETGKYSVFYAKVVEYAVGHGNILRAKHKAGLLQVELSPETFEKAQENIHFDSSFEIDVFQVLKDAFGSVTVLREPRVLVKDGTVFLPDFSVRYGQKEFFVEIVGWWTPEYIRKKAEKLRVFGGDVLVVANERFAVESQNIPSDVIVFSKKIPFLQIVKKLREKMKIEEGARSEEKDEKERFESFVRELEREVKREGELPLSRVRKIAEKFRVKFSTAELEKAGFEVEVSGLFDGKVKLK